MTKFLATLLVLFLSSVSWASWPEGQFESRFVEVQGSNIHYVEHGQGDPILLVHGIPTWSYLWRDLIEPLSANGRVIAVDLIGYGKSDKPNIQYRLADLRDYLEGFIDELALSNIRLVVHDLGGPVALPLLAERPELFSGVAAFETLLGPVDKLAELNDFQVSLRDRKPGPGIIGPGGQGYDLIVRNNIFRDLVTQATQGTNVNIEEYYQPFSSPLDLFAIYNPFQDLPVESRPFTEFKAAKKAVQFMQYSAIPKLYIYPTPGFASVLKAGSPELASTFRNITIEPFGPGNHYLQEENPALLAQLINNWLSQNF